MILAQPTDLCARIAKHEARYTAVELAVQQFGRGRFVLWIDDDAGGGEASPQLRAPRWRDCEVLRRRPQLECVLIERGEPRLRLGCDDEPNEILLGRRQCVVGDDEVRCDAATTVHRASSVRFEGGTR